MAKKKITILKDGPYSVSGAVPLKEKNIKEETYGNKWEEVRDFPAQETMVLCRCGESKNKPFCDGSHVSCGFVGDETASKASYRKRAELLEGAQVDILDDKRCILARFCHLGRSDVWELTELSDNEGHRKAAIEGACACPAGRLTAVDKEGNVIEPVLDEEIIMIRQPQREQTSGLYVTGGIPLESSDGELYETRNRYVLCRCGKSNNKPFCDASHETCKKQA